MKLLAELKRRVAKIGPLRRAWFTTFNLDIEFLETFVLPATIGAEQPRNRIEFEQLQLELNNTGIDFRVFCDPRFIDTNRIKRTCIPIHAIRPDRIAERFSERSLFHPKIIYLEDVNDRCVIGAGSANLTVSGWGRNLESFVFREIESMKNYREVRKFFAKLWNAAAIADAKPRLGRSRRFAKDRENWRFVHSMQNSPFTAELLKESKHQDLVVWSPYLPRDLASFIAKLQTSATIEGLRIHLVPDRIQNKFLRTEWSAKLAEMIDDGQLTFYDRPVEQDPRAELCHAKIWKVGETLAIGSWNFTGPGSNSLCNKKGSWSKENNVEAGIIIEDENDWRLAAGEVLHLGEQDCAPTELLAEEALNPAELPPFDLHVLFNWYAQAYAFSGTWPGNDGRHEHVVCLPGVQAPVPLKWEPSGGPMQPGQIRVDDRAILQDRVFRVHQNGNEIYRGIISETNVSSRRVQAFNNLKDLLDAIILGDDSNSQTDVPLRWPDDGDSFPDVSLGQPEDGTDQIEHGMSEHSSISYFRLFKSMRDYRARYSAVAKLAELEKRVFVVPGCLLELVEKTHEALKIKERPVFNWFLANEVAVVCKEVKQHREKLARAAQSPEPGISPRWELLQVSVPAPPSNVEPKYIELVRNQSGYD